MIHAPMGMSPGLWGLFLMGLFGYLLWVGITKANTPEIAFNIQIFICIVSLFYLGIQTITTPGVFGGGGGYVYR